MILNSEETKSLGELLANKGIINAVKCSVCHNLTAFEDEDIVWTPQVIFMDNRDVEKGYIGCPWCKNSMYVAQRQQSAVGMMITHKYFSTIEGGDYDEVKYEVKNGRGIEKKKQLRVRESLRKLKFVILNRKGISWRAGKYLRGKRNLYEIWIILMKNEVFVMIDVRSGPDLYRLPYSVFKVHYIKKKERLLSGVPSKTQR